MRRKRTPFPVCSHVGCLTTAVVVEWANPSVPNALCARHAPRSLLTDAYDHYTRTGDNNVGVWLTEPDWAKP